MAATARTKNYSVFQNKDNIKSHAITLCLGGCLALICLALPVFCMQPFWVGYYNQTEGPIAMTWGLGGLSALWLACMAYQKNICLKQIYSDPLVWGMFLLALVSAMFSLCHALPLRSWVGSPDMGEGVLTFLSLGFMTSLFLILLQNDFYRKLLIALASMAVLLFSLGTFLGSNESPFHQYRYWTWTAYFFPDFIAYFGVAFIAFYAVTLDWAKNAKFKYVVHLFYMLGLGFISYASSNKTFQYGLIIALIGAGVIQLLGKTRKAYSAWLYLAIIGVSLGFLLFLMFPGPFEESLPSTLASRGDLLKFVFVPEIHEMHWEYCLKFLFGHGWGGYHDFVMTNLFDTDVFTLYKDSVWEPSREAIVRSFFHSHNNLAEAFSSIGLLGLLVYCFVHYAMIRQYNWSKRFFATVFILIYCLTHAFWFQLSATVPYVLLGFCCLFNRKNADAAKAGFSLPVWATASLGGILIGLCGLFLIFSKNIESTLNLDAHARFDEQQRNIINNPWFKLDKYLGFKRGIEVMRRNSLFALEHIGRSPGLAPLYVFDGNVLLANTLFENRQGCGNLFACSSGLNIISEMANNKGFKALFAKENLKDSWKKMSLAYLECAPKRTDMLVPYFSRLILEKNFDAIWPIIRSIRQFNPNDPVALWFSGVIHLEEDDKVMLAMQELNLSLDTGIERVMPISAEQKQQIRRYRSTH